MRQQYCQGVKRCIMKLPWLRQVEQRETKQILHPVPYIELQVDNTQWSSVSLHDAELRVISPRASFLCRSTSVRLWGKRSRRHGNSSKQHQSQPNVFAVTVIVVALDRSLYCVSLSLPPPSLSAQLPILQIRHRIHEPQFACIHPGVVQ